MCLCFRINKIGPMRTGKISLSNESNFLHTMQITVSEYGSHSTNSWIPSCKITTLRAGSSGIMVWAMLFFYTWDPLIYMDTIQNTAAYLKIVEYHVYSFAFIMFRCEEGNFQQKDAPCNHDLWLSDWFEIHERGLKCLHGHLSLLNLIL